MVSRQLSRPVSAKLNQIHEIILNTFSLEGFVETQNCASAGLFIFINT